MWARTARRFKTAYHSLRDRARMIAELGGAEVSLPEVDVKGLTREVVSEAVIERVREHVQMIRLAMEETKVQDKRLKGVFKESLLEF